ncbi:hypothetical protein [Halorarum salinum]|uniref:Uncharacterized protein n=1 Tax=Halorarum salinum TaxID=2743089 RepID=A0A7D5L8W7_9EURY|nr:hypothetical protein [Halobaculum salinum]QLG60710.1 hypothetical protein HUG12_02700 [Halobaculum salinum]
MTTAVGASRDGSGRARVFYGNRASTDPTKPSEREATTERIRDVHRAVNGTWLTLLGLGVFLATPFTPIDVLGGSLVLAGGYLVVDSVLENPA